MLLADSLFPLGYQVFGDPAACWLAWSATQWYFWLPQNPCCAFHQATTCVPYPLLVLSSAPIHLDAEGASDTWISFLLDRGSLPSWPFCVQTRSAWVCPVSGSRAGTPLPWNPQHPVSLTSSFPSAHKAVEVYLRSSMYTPKPYFSLFLIFIPQNLGRKLRASLLIPFYHDLLLSPASWLSVSSVWYRQPERWQVFLKSYTC